jgi:hypothetical protein
MSAPDHGAPSGDELDSDEPRTPLWLPLLGLALFLSALIYLVVGGKPEATAPAPAGSASAADSAAAPAPAPAD